MATNEIDNGLNSVAEDFPDENTKQGEAALLSLFRAFPIGVGIVVDRVIKQVNDRFCDMIGYGVEELIGKEARILYPSEAEFARVGKEKYSQIEKQGSGTIETKFKCKDGSIIDILLSSAPLDPKNLARGVTFTALDITERKRAEEALQESQRLINTVMTATPDIVYVFDVQERKLVFTNRNIAEILGYSPSEIEAMGDNLIKLLLHPEDFAELGRLMRDWSRAKDEDVVTTEFRLKTKGGEWRWFRGRDKVFKRAPDGTVSQVIGTGHDSTSLRLAEETLRDSEKQLRALAARLQEVEEIERREIARELHDQVGQNLTALHINLKILQKQFAHQASQKMITRLQDSMDLLEETAQRIRNVMAELRPQVLDDYGLIAALRWYGGLFSDRTNISVSFNESDAPARLPEQLESALFRITQEALTNVAKHASADNVSLAVEHKKDHLHLIICDNGIGFNMQTASSGNDGHGWGLLTMQERAQALGGKLTIKSAPGQGTRVEVVVKLRDAEYPNSA